MLQGLRAAIKAQALAHQRDPAEVAILAVSKRHSEQAIRHLAEAGQTAFGESYVDEALVKIGKLKDLSLEWHFIGPIQSNKTAHIAAHFHWVHSVDRSKLLRRLSDQRPVELDPLNICLQIKLADEPGKSGANLDEALELAALADRLPRLKLRGLMCIPPPSDDETQQRGWFSQLRGLLDELNAAGHSLDTLSMGMSNDIQSAIAEGATIVRVGTALFGPRPD